MINVGILALQGAVQEHQRLLELSGAKVQIVKQPADLSGIDGLVIPGGESTTMYKLMQEYHLVEPILQLYRRGCPIWGTCAGLILLAKEVEGGIPALSLMDICVRRNAFGRQKESFEAVLPIEDFDESFVGVFIRAPYIVSVGDSVKVLAWWEDKIVAVQQGTLLATAFHPELTDDLRFHAHFVRMIEESKGKSGNRV